MADKKKQAPKKQVKSSGASKPKGRVKPNVPKAGFKPGHKYGCGGKKSC